MPEIDNQAAFSLWIRSGLTLLTGGDRSHQFWGSVLGIAAIGKCGSKEEAARRLQGNETKDGLIILLEISPRFASRIERLFKEGGESPQFVVSVFSDVMRS